MFTKEENKKHEESILKAQQENKKNGKRGKVAVARKPHWQRDKKKGLTHPRKPGYKNIDTTKGNRSIFSELSPFVLGPVNSNPPAMNVENAWQFSKVYEGDVDESGKPKPEFYKRRDKGFADSKGRRKSNHIGSYLFHMWEGKRLSKSEARKKILMKYCRELSLKTEAYKKLKALVDDGVNVQILGYDAREYDGSTDPDGKLLRKMLNDVTQPFCQEFSLAAMLMNVDFDQANLQDKNNLEEK